MKSKDKREKSAKSSDEIQKFPLRGLYFVVIFILTLLSLVKLSIQSDNTSTFPWKTSAEIQVNSITLILLLLIWLPLLIPWIVSISPRFQTFLTGLRESGLEEVEAGILRIKLTAGIEKAADMYEKKVLDSDKLATTNVQEIEKLENSYRESIESVSRMSKNLTSSEAMSKVDELGLYYDRIRETMPSGHERSQLMRSVESAMWALIPSIQNFPIRARLNSTKGGERISAYKFLEWQPSIEYIDLLLARSIGVLEVPFAQYAALLTLRRLVVNLDIDKNTQNRILQILMWNSQIDFLGEDRRSLMKSIISILEKKAKSA